MEKKNIKLSLFVDDQTIYIKDSKDTTRKLLEHISEFDRGAGTKINAHKSVAFLYSNNERLEREIQETIPFIIAAKTIKYLLINLPKYAKGLFSQNYKMLMK